MEDSRPSNSESAYYARLAAAAERLARSARIRAVDPASSGGHRVYEDMRAVKAAMEAPR